MTYISDIGRWITENEALLSGMAALVVLAGVIFSPIGRGVGRLFSRRNASPSPNPAPVAATPGAQTMAPVGAAEAKLPSEPLLAVLAFDNLSSDPEMQFFSDGVSEETSLLFQAGMPELRNDPRFAHLCARLGLVEYWLATDKWPDCAPEVPYDFQAECTKAQGISKDDFGP